MKVRISQLVNFLVVLPLFVFMIAVQMSQGINNPLPVIVWVMMIFVVFVEISLELGDIYSKVKNLKSYEDIAKYHKLRTSLKKYIENAKSSSYGNLLIDEGMVDTVKEIDGIIDEVDKN
jgi:hypothetical protein